ncbi:hypothetical protein [Rhodanobacter sp. BL-MT-08]
MSRTFEKLSGGRTLARISVCDVVIGPERISVRSTGRGFAESRQTILTVLRKQFVTNVPRFRKFIRDATKSACAHNVGRDSTNK